MLLRHIVSCVGPFGFQALAVFWPTESRPRGIAIFVNVVNVFVNAQMPHCYCGMRILSPLLLPLIQLSHRNLCRLLLHGIKRDHLANF